MLRPKCPSSPRSVTNLLVSLFPSALLPWVNLPMTEQAWSLLSGNQTSVSKMLLEGDDCLPDFERPQQARLCQEGKELGPTTFGEMPSKPGWDDRMAGSLKLPFLNLCEACAYVFGERAINCHLCHAVSDTRTARNRVWLHPYPGRMLDSRPSCR